MQEKSLLHRTWFLIILFVILWNSGFIGAEYALPFAGPLTLLFWRYWILVFILLLYLAVRKRLTWPGNRAVAIAMMTGILAHGIWLGCVFYAQKSGVPSGIIALVVALQPMTTGLFSGLVAGEKTSLTGWAGLFTGLAGVLIAVVSRIEFSDPNSVFAYFIPFGSVVAITAASLIQRRLQVKKDVNRLSVDLSLFYQGLGVSLIVTLPAVFFEQLETEWSFIFTGGLLWLILVVSLGAYGLMWLLIERIDATRVASLFYFGPPVTMVMTWFAFGDLLISTDIIGLVVIFIGVALIQSKSGIPSTIQRN